MKPTQKLTPSMGFPYFVPAWTEAEIAELRMRATIKRVTGELEGQPSLYDIEKAVRTERLLEGGLSAMQRAVLTKAAFRQIAAAAKPASGIKSESCREDQ